MLSLISSVLLILAFPDFEIWFLAWFGLIPLFFGVDAEKESFRKSFVLGWLWGIVFYFGTGWWLTYAPITYAGIPTVIAYFLLFCACAFIGLYTALFAGLYSRILRRFGIWGIFASPFLWVAIEFLRLWTSGNNWNAVGYSQTYSGLVKFASIGGVFLVGFIVVLINSFLLFAHKIIEQESEVRLLSFEIPRSVFRAEFDGLKAEFSGVKQRTLAACMLLVALVFAMFLWLFPENSLLAKTTPAASVIAVQPNVPMSGLSESKWLVLRKRQAELAKIEMANPSFFDAARRQAEIDALPDNLEKRTRFYDELATETFRKGKKIIILPESPMNFQFGSDKDFRQFIKKFAAETSASVLFNSAERDERRKNGYFNSAVFVNEKGEKLVQYDKIYLLPFGEFVPLPDFLGQYVPTMVGRFSPGEEYDLLPFGDAKAGVMICFESHFPSLAREFVRNGADILVEMTNDGYLGDTPVLRQHLASAVFRAVETNRPVIRVTNIGITAYINERGEVLDEAGVYQEAIRAWSVSKSDGGKTVYVRFGEWFAFLCLFVSLGIFSWCFLKR